jgi:signal transduction histidine kinase
VNRRRLAWTIWGVSAVVVLLWVPIDASVPSSQSDVGEYLFVVAAVLLYSTVGALITSRDLGNRVGLLFSWVGLAAAVSVVAGAYASLALERGLPVVGPAAWVGRVGFAAMIGPLAFLFLIFPTGTPPSRRWGWLLRVMLAAYAVNIVAFALTPGPLNAGFAELHGRVQNPIGLPSAWTRTVENFTVAAGFIVFGGAIVSILALIQRYRRASSTERLQIRWLAFLGAFLGAYVLAMLLLTATGVVPEEGNLSNITFFILIFLVFFGIPITCGVAILRHGLWDLGVVVRKTVQYGVIVGVILAVALATLVAAPVVVVGRGGALPPGTILGVAVGILISTIVIALRIPARRIADRLVYRKRATPYEVLSTFAERVGGTYSTEDVLPRMAQLLGEATGARDARVWLRVGDAMRAEASWPSNAPAAGDRPIRADEVPMFEDAHAFEVRHQGELLGALTLTEAPDDPMSPTKEKLARDMAAQAGLVLRNVALIEDLRESRRRIVSAQDERARTLERNIHDGAQQQLVALSVKLRLAEGLLDRDPAKAHELLSELQTQATETLDDLRDLARGIYPPLLADQGLPAALEAQARRSPTPVTIEPDGVGRYGQDVESAVYFSCLEALNNVAKYAEASAVFVRLSQENGWLRFEVQDDGRGFEVTARSYGTGLQGIADRLAALGGELAIRSALGDGTTVAGRLPVEDTA